MLFVGESEGGMEEQGPSEARLTITETKTCRSLRLTTYAVLSTLLSFCFTRITLTLSKLYDEGLLRHGDLSRCCRLPVVEHDEALKLVMRVHTTF